MPAATVFRLGVYKHHRGGLYTAVGLVAHHETRATMVLYFSREHGSFNVRPMYGVTGDPDGFLDSVSIGVRRFEYVGPVT